MEGDDAFDLTRIRWRSVHGMMSHPTSQTKGGIIEKQLLPDLASGPGPLPKGGRDQLCSRKSCPFPNARIFRVGKDHQIHFPWFSNNGVKQMKGGDLRPCGVMGAGKSSIERNFGSHAGTSRGGPLPRLPIYRQAKGQQER